MVTWQPVSIFNKGYLATCEYHGPQQWLPGNLHVPCPNLSPMATNILYIPSPDCPWLPILTVAHPVLMYPDVLTETEYKCFIVDRPSNTLTPLTV